MPRSIAAPLCFRLLIRTLSVAASLPLAAGATPLHDVQTAAAEWARLRSATTRIEKDWAAEQALLDASIDNLNTQADQLELQHRAAVADAAAAQQAVDDLTAANQQRAADLAMANQRIAALADRLAAQRPALPPRLSAALDLPFRTLTNPDLSPADRMRHTMAILNRCQQFDQAFVLAEEILPVTPGGEPRLLEVVYFGLAQACALDRSADQAYLGRPVDGTWQWIHVPDLADEAAHLIEVRQDNVPPAFVRLPLQLTGGAR